MGAKINIEIPDKVSGFTICRNSKKLGYPFLESIASLAPLCDEIVIALDDTQDGTWPALLDLRTQLRCDVNIFESRWDMNNMKGGAELARQTNIALDRCKHNVVFYLQSDEVLHEKEYEKIRRDLRSLQQSQEAASLVFNWIHFYGDPQTTVHSRKWYRREIRAFKKNSGLKSYLDAQSFRKPVGDHFEKLPALLSEAHVLHYGYVRPKDLMAEKVNYFHDQWKSGAAHSRPDNVFKAQFGIQKYEGTHPALMQTFLAKLPESNPHAYELLAPKFSAKNFRYWISDLIEKSTGKRLGEFKSYSKIV